MPFASVKQSQFQPLTDYSKVDCVLACVAHLVNRATVDALKPSHADTRKASGITAIRGLTYTEGAKAAAAFGVTLTPRFGISRADLHDLVASGRALAISIDCSVTVNTPYRTNNFTGDHSVYANACTATTYAVEDTGTTTAGYLDWPADLLYRAAEARTGGHGINVLVGPDTEGVSWKAIDDAAIRTEPSYSKGTTVRKLKVGETLSGGRTQAGGNWKRASGSYGNGWVHVHVGTRWLWVKGKAVKQA